MAWKYGITALMISESVASKSTEKIDNRIRGDSVRPRCAGSFLPHFPPALSREVGDRPTSGLEQREQPPACRIDVRQLSGLDALVEDVTRSIREISAEVGVTRRAKI